MKKVNSHLVAFKASCKRQKMRNNKDGKLFHDYYGNFYHGLDLNFL